MNAMLIFKKFRELSVNVSKNDKILMKSPRIYHYWINIYHGIFYYVVNYHVLNLSKLLLKMMCRYF